MNKKENKINISLGDTRPLLEAIADEIGELSLSATVRQLIIEKAREMGIKTNNGKGE